TAAAVSTLEYLGALDAIVGALRPLTAALGLPASFAGSNSYSQRGQFTRSPPARPRRPRRR
ncbi:hypothetical protein DJ84_07895, partial [Halorubrum ezzemoulense]